MNVCLPLGRFWRVEACMPSRAILPVLGSVGLGDDSRSKADANVFYAALLVHSEREIINVEEVFDDWFQYGIATQATDKRGISRRGTLS